MRVSLGLDLPVVALGAPAMAQAAAHAGRAFRSHRHLDQRQPDAGQPPARPDQAGGDGRGGEGHRRQYADRRRATLQAGLDDKIDPNQGAPAKGGSDFGAKGYNSFWLSTGDSLARVRANIARRTSSIRRAARFPHKDPAAVMAKARVAGIKYMTGVGEDEGPEVIGLAERCLLGFSGAAGPGILTPMYNNTYQFVQTKDHVVIDMVEMVHDARIIPIYRDAATARASHKPAVIKPWMGDSVGWWRAICSSLKPPTFTPHRVRTSSRYLPIGKATERFQRLLKDEIFYSFTVEDPETLAAL